jgi:hypothetical protein
MLSEQRVETQDVPTGLPVVTVPDVHTELPVKTGDVLSELSLGSKNVKICFDYETAKFTNIIDSHVKRWREAYPAVDVLTELRQMEIWADTNRKNRKSDWQRFIVNWLKRSQDRARPVRTPETGGRYGGNGGYRGKINSGKQSTVGKTEEPASEGIYGPPDYVWNVDDHEVVQRTA